MLLIWTHEAQSDVVSFLEGGFSWSALTPLPNATTDDNGFIHRPVIQGYTLGDWEESQTVIQILQADVMRGSDLDAQVEQFMPTEEDEDAPDTLNAVGVEVD